MQTYEAKVHIGLREGYTGPIHTYEEAKQICKSYCDRVGLGVTLMQGECIYTRGDEPYVQVGLINYPRFPSDPETIWNHARHIGDMLARTFNQQRYTIVATDKTEMFEAPFVCS